MLRVPSFIGCHSELQPNVSVCWGCLTVFMTISVIGHEHTIQLSHVTKWTSDAHLEDLESSSACHFYFSCSVILSCVAAFWLFKANERTLCRFWGLKVVGDLERCQIPCMHTDDIHRGFKRSLLWSMSHWHWMLQCPEVTKHKEKR